MACKYKKDLNDYNFCLKAGYYCTYEQEKTCKCKEEKEKRLTMAEWISVKDRLPEYNKDVLVYTKMGYMDVDFNESSFSANFYRHNRDVTHWMPLPEAPKGE